MVHNSFFEPDVVSSGALLSLLVNMEKEARSHPELQTLRMIPPGLLAQWLMAIQRPDGSVPSSNKDYNNCAPSVFGSAFFLNGLMDYFLATSDRQALNALHKNIHWLMLLQDEKGSWKYYTMNQQARCALTAAAMIRLGHMQSNPSIVKAGAKHIGWLIERQEKDGFFDLQDEDRTFFLSDFGYCLSGILSASELLNKPEWTKAVYLSYEKLFSMANRNGSVPAEIDRGFSSGVNYFSLHGNCLLASVGFRLSTLTGSDDRIRHNAMQMLDFVKRRQIKIKDRNQTGAITASWPVSGRFHPYEITTEGVCAFIEALVLETKSNLPVPEAEK